MKVVGPQYLRAAKSYALAAASSSSYAPDHKHHVNLRITAKGIHEYISSETVNTLAKQFT